MRQVTIELDEHVAHWARARAAEHGVPIAQLIGEMLRWKMLDEEGFETSGPPADEPRERPVAAETSGQRRRVTVRRYATR